VGQEEKLAMAVKNHLGRPRYTKLASGSADQRQATRRSWRYFFLLRQLQSALMPRVAEVDGSACRTDNQAGGSINESRGKVEEQHLSRLSLPAESERRGRPPSEELQVPISVALTGVSESQGWHPSSQNFGVHPESARWLQSLPSP